MPPHVDTYAYICALPREAKHLQRLPHVRDGFAVVVCSGVGARNAERAARELIQRQRPFQIRSAGVAGALSPKLKVGDVVMAHCVIDAVTGEHLPRELIPRLPMPSQTIVTVPRMITSPQEKRQLHERYDAAAVDMESAAIARVCKEESIGFLAIRAISDTADEVIPEFISKFFDRNGRLQPGKVAMELWKNPSCITALRRLDRQSRAACEALEKHLAEPLTR